MAAAAAVRAAERDAPNIVAQVSGRGGVGPTANGTAGTLVQVAAAVRTAARAALQNVARVAARGGAVAAADV